MDLDPTRPFSRKHALAAGVTPQQLRGPRYRSIHVGVFVAAEVEVTPWVRAAAALVPFHPTAFASHATAARVWNLPIPSLPEEHVTVVDKGHRRRRTDIECHYAPNGLIRRLDGVRVAAVEQTFVDLATLLPLVELVVVGDHLVRRGLIGLPALQRFCATTRAPGAKAAATAVAFVRAGVDSPMESRVRMLIVLAGLPEPRVNLTFDDEGLMRRKYDLCWPEIKLIVEYDGRHHVERIEQWASDLSRREAIDDDGWRIIVLIAADIYVHPGATVAKLHRLLCQRHHPRVPVRPSTGWELHFPGRS